MPGRGVRTSSIVLTVAALLAAATVFAQTKMLRFPDIHGNTVVFSYAGDLWTAPAGGGTATRLTAHPGLEMFARFSPDGKEIAFTGQFDGDEQVYVVPAAGGVPRQLTYYPARGPFPPRGGYDNLVYGWTPDGKSIVFRSLRDADGIRSEGNLYTVPAAGGGSRSRTPRSCPTSVPVRRCGSTTAASRSRSPTPRSGCSRWTSTGSTRSTASCC